MPTDGRSKKSPKPGRSEQNKAVRIKAHERLDQMCEMAEANQTYGTVGVQVTFERGEATLVRRTIDGTDRR